MMCKINHIIFVNTTYHVVSIYDGVLTSPLGIPDILGTKLGPPLGLTLGIAVGQSDTDG